MGHLSGYPMIEEGPFAGIEIRELIDVTLPPDHIKVLCGGQATVFKLDLETETAIPVATWPECSPG